MGLIQIYFISAVLFSLFCESNLQGLTCVNDFINNVTCTLNSFPKESGQNCMIFGYKKIWKKRIRDISIQSCKVKQCCNALPGCSFVFEKKFSLFETMPNISMECNNVLVEKLKDYNVASHIKIHPPDRPFVNHTDNDPMIYWGPGSPRSVFLTVFEYKVQIQKRDPMIKEVHTFPTDTPQLNTTALGLEGEHYIRVKVKPADRENSQWSDWSPSVSWVAPSAKPKSSKREAFIVYAALFFSIVTMVIFYKSGIRKRFFQVKPVPNPSKYFKTPQGGNPKTLLSPNCAGVSLHTAQPPDHISPVEVCESCEEVTSRYPSPSANHVPPNYLEASSGSDASALVDNSSSSSCFSNLGYFVNGSSGSSVQNKSNHVYFAYKNEFHVLHKARDANLCLPFHLCPVLANSPSCESLKRGVQSPDSGICNEKEDEDEEVKDDTGVNREEDQISGRHSSSHLSLPLHLPTEICSPSTPLCLTHIPSDSIKMHASTLTANVSATGWPLACTMDRPSSMPEESEKTGYFILQEIKTTSRNASI